MKLFELSRWTLNQKLALAAVLLGALAVAGDPYGGGKVEIDADELARVVQSEVDHVTAPQLADWILAGRTDFRILDLRDEEAYAAYHVPGAERVPVTRLADYPLYRNEPIVLYSDGGIHSAQGWFLLRAQGYAGASILLGGLDAWKDEVLFPVVADGLEPGVAERLREVAEHFGGQPRGGGAAQADESYDLPEVAMPAAPAAPPPSTKRKKREGC
jgi:rhodanese-related sulfurtransferase